MELIRANAGQWTQIIATTHSPTVLAWLDESEYATTFFAVAIRRRAKRRLTCSAATAGFNEAPAQSGG